MFACLAHALLLRSDAAGLTDGAALVYTNLYNIADVQLALADGPDQGLGRCVACSVLTARELTVTELDAEHLAARSCAGSISGWPRSQASRRAASSGCGCGRLRDSSRSSSS